MALETALVQFGVGLQISEMVHSTNTLNLGLIRAYTLFELQIVCLTLSLTVAFDGESVVKTKMFSL